MTSRPWHDPWPRVVALVVFGAALATHRAVPLLPTDGTAVVVAKALAGGEGLRYLHLPGMPMAVAQGPLYPVLLSLLWSVWPSFPANQALFHLVDAATLGGAAWVMLAHARRRRLESAAFFVAIPVALLAAPLLGLTGARSGGPLFLLLAAAAVSLADDDAPSPLRAALGGVCAGLASLVFPVGVAVIAGVAAAFWGRAQRREALIAAGIGIAMAAPWLAWAISHGNEILEPIRGQYGSPRLALLTPAELAGVVRAAVAPVPFAVGLPIVIAAAVATAWGAVLSYRRAPAMASVLAGIVLATLLVAPRVDGVAWIVLPWAAACFAAGSTWAWSRRGGYRASAAAVTVLLAVMFSGWELDRLRRLTAGPPDYPAMRLVVFSVGAETPRDAIIATDHEGLLFLMAGRRAVPGYPFSSPSGAPDGERIIRWYCDAGVTLLASMSPSSDLAATADLLARRAERPIEALFTMTDGPALHAFRCPS